VDTLHVSQVAWVLKDDLDGIRNMQLEAVKVTLEPFMNIDDAGGESSRLFGVEEVPVVLQGRSAASRIDDHRRVAREGRHGVEGSFDGTFVPPAVRVESAATVPGRSDSVGESERLHDVGHGPMDRALPDVVDAAGEYPDVRIG